MTNWRLQLGGPLTDGQLDRAERHLGRFLPEEARELYRWHDGCTPWIVPHLGFNSLEWSSKMHLVMRDFTIPALSNAPGGVEPGTLFPVFNIDAVTFNVLAIPGHRTAASALYLLDSEYDQLTMVAHTVSDFIDYLIREFEAGHVRPTQHDVSWARFGFEPNMVPHGKSAKHGRRGCGSRR